MEEPLPLAVLNKQYITLHYWPRTKEPLIIQSSQTLSIFVQQEKCDTPADRSVHIALGSEEKNK